MNGVQQFMMVLGIGAPSVYLLSRVTLCWSSRLKIHQAFRKNGASITRIRRFDGFSDLGSVWKAATSTPYIVTVVAQDGRESDLFCLVRYIPIVGFAMSVEIWSDEFCNAH
ncbi:hypothetical protein [Chthoniobacter flavus]|uniref:hypothetical protein n=1 Tax=Chthoniobacter flavus TaxID=191863 RepID=UPI0005B2E208|nr:hypothetical protein [Chthoniobacter flavus]